MFESNTLTLSARTNGQPDLTSLKAIKAWWTDNKDCFNHSMSSGAYARRSDCEAYGTTSVSFRYKDKREQAILELVDGHWHCNGTKFCPATHLQKQ